MVPPSETPGIDNVKNMLNVESETSEPLTLLVSSDEDGALILSLNGLFPVTYLHLTGPAAVAVSCCASGDLRTLFFWAETLDGPKLEAYEIGFVSRYQSEVQLHELMLFVYICNF